MFGTKNSRTSETNRADTMTLLRQELQGRRGSHLTEHARLASLLRPSLRMVLVFLLADTTTGPMAFSFVLFIIVPATVQPLPDSVTLMSHFLLSPVSLPEATWCRMGPLNTTRLCLIHRQNECASSNALPIGRFCANSVKLGSSQRSTFVACLVVRAPPAGSFCCRYSRTYFSMLYISSQYRMKHPLVTHILNCVTQIEQQFTAASAPTLFSAFNLQIHFEVFFWNVRVRAHTGFVNENMRNNCMFR